MYIKPQPIGVTPPASEDAMPLWRATSGDKLVLRSKVYLLDGTPVQVSNSILTFVLAGTRFDHEALWTGKWLEGISEVDPVNHPGLIEVFIPADVGNHLRRGVYNFSMTVTGLLKQNPLVTLKGSLLIEYEPSSPEHNIPYKHHHCPDFYDWNDQNDQVYP